MPAEDTRSGFLPWYVAHRHAVLFFSLLFTLVAAPLLAMFEVRGVVLQTVLAANLLACVLGLANERARRLLLLPAVPIIAISLAPSSVIPAEWTSIALYGFFLVALLAAAESVRFVMRAGEIDAEHVYAALSVYLLGGVFFGMLHWNIGATWPGSYAEASHPGTPLSLSDAIYFSFVTIASLGYGDIVPVSDVARGAATLEAVGGQLYLAAIIARLVGAWMPTGR